MFELSPFLYAPVYYWTAFCICSIMFILYSGSANNKLLLQQNSYIPALILSVLVILFLGLRPLHYAFGDMVIYARGYRYGETIGYVDDIKGEWVFGLLQTICIRLGWSVNIFFLICSIGYIGFQYWACKKLLWENSWMAMLFVLSSFEFYVFAVNGIRNGLACAMVMFAMSVAITAEKRKIILLIALGIAYLAFGIHKSTAISSVCAILAYSCVKNPKYTIYLWIATIPISLAFGTRFIGLFLSYFDDGRSVYYGLGPASDGIQFSRTGFRWDFLLYSSVPVALIYYATQKKGIYDAVFNFLSNTYLLANSFWVLVNEANYSNRYAYLSWFLYPLVLAYGLIRLHIWDNQDRRIGFFLLLHAGFTLIMYLLGKL